MRGRGQKVVAPRVARTWGGSVLATLGFTWHDRAVLV